MTQRNQRHKVLRDDVRVSENVAKFLDNQSMSARHRSFDYCYNYFQDARTANEQHQLTSADRIELSCLHLGFYLASWGMYRGSGQLLNNSMSALESVIGVISTTPEEVWAIDAGKYDAAAIDMVLDVASQLRKAFPGQASPTLLTKTMLGTFGVVPAFDQFFVRGFGVRTLNRTSLQEIDAFVHNNRDAIEAARTSTIRFHTGEASGHRYTAAKVLDMVFYIEGGGRLA